MTKIFLAVELPGAIEKQRGYLKLIFEGQEAALQVHQQFGVRKLLLSINIIYYTISAGRYNQ